MRVFVAGATGVIGRSLVPKLVAAGHEVTGMTRSESKTPALREAGAEPVIADAFDRERLREVIAASSPEVVVNELTDMPRAVNPRKLREQFARHDRLRSEGVVNLVDAARDAGARRVVAQSIASVYAPRATAVKQEDDPLYLDAPFPWRRSIEAVQVLEQTVTGQEGLEGVILRYGYLYGPGTWFASDGSIAEMVRRRRYPIVGSGQGWFSFVHVDDAANATVAAVERGAPGIYNVVDEDPARVRDWLPVYADALGAAPPRRVPKLLALLVAGRVAVIVMTEQRGAVNAKAKAELGWEPGWTTWRKGFREALG